MDDRLKLIDDVIETFNFKKVHIAMTALDWQWVSKDGTTCEVPSMERLEEMARHLLRQAMHKRVITGSGGFEARYVPKVDEHDECFTLKFVLASVSTDPDE